MLPSEHLYWADCTGNHCVPIDARGRCGGCCRAALPRRESYPQVLEQSPGVIVTNAQRRRDEQFIGPVVVRIALARGQWVLARDWRMELACSKNRRDILSSWSMAPRVRH